MAKETEAPKRPKGRGPGKRFTPKNYTGPDAFPPPTRRGARNRLPAIKELVHTVLCEDLDSDGGRTYLRKVAMKRPADFVKLVAKLLPQEIAARVEGAGLPLVVINDYAGQGTGDLEALRGALEGGGLDPVTIEAEVTRLSAGELVPSEEPVP